jgi:FkbH-like protein
MNRCLLHDVDSLSSNYGKLAWYDERFYFDSKLPCSPVFLPFYAQSLSSIIGAIKGKSKKCLVLDLDNTLWGGVIGDDGVGGIKLGQGDPDGEAFISFQNYLKRLKARGIILAVCSKNDAENAKSPFYDHEEMVLKLEDISCFVANWQDKASNIKKIAGTLSIGLDSLVFIDDNPVERAIVRRFLPEVAVPEITEDPSDNIKAIEKHRFFELISLSKEDLKRSEMYLNETKRKVKLSKANNLDEYLQSLNMKAIVESINDSNIDRSVQLINKTNQFNLTTKRYQKSEILKIIKDKSWSTFALRLKDDFGDNGLISVVLTQKNGEKLAIDTWLMSCRVLNRNVEEFMMSKIYKMAKENKIKTIEGYYWPTKKNKMVKDLFSKFGFEKQNESENESVSWAFDLNKNEDRVWMNWIKEG